MVWDFKTLGENYALKISITFSKEVLHGAVTALQPSDRKQVE